MTKTAEELREASHVACEKMREDMETLRNSLILNQLKTAELDRLIEQLQAEGKRTAKAPVLP